MRSLSTAMALLGVLAAGAAEAAWQPKTSPTTQPLRAVHMHSGQGVWASGGSTAPIVVKSGDHFATAAQVANLPASVTLPLNTIWSSSSGAVIEAYGNGQTTLRSADGGATWTTLKPSNPFSGSINFSAAAHPTGSTAYLAGFNNSTLGWFRGRLTALGSAVDDSADAAFSDFTVNAAIFPERFVALQYQTADSGYLATEFTLMQQTGATGWRKLLGPAPATLKALSFADAQHGIVVGTNSFTWVVTPTDFDGRAPTTPPEPGKTLNGVYLSPNLKYGVVVGNGGFLSETYDGGLTWKTKASGTTQDLLAVHCFDENTCAAVGTNGTLLSYVNAAPTTVGTLSDTEGGEGELIIATITVQDAEGDTISVDPAAGFPAPITGGSWTLTNNQLQATFTVPAVLCGDQTITLAPVLSDGRKSQAASITFTVRDQQPDPPQNVGITLSVPQPPAWVPGAVYTATASGTSQCGRPLTYAFTTSGNLPTPTVNGAVATFDFTGPLCSPISGTLTVEASDAGAKTTASRPITVEASKIAPSASVAFTGGLADGATLREGQSTTVSIGASHVCSSSFDYTWSCTGLATTPTGSSFTLTNQGLCDPQEVRCSVEVATIGHPPATVTFTLQLEESKKAPLAAATYGNGQVLQLGQSSTATIAPSHACQTFAFASTCSGPKTASSHTESFAHNVAELCSSRVDRCTVTVTPLGAGGAPRGTPVEVPVEVTLEETKFAPVLSATLTNGSQTQTLQNGEATTATATATHACNPTPAVSWTCDDGSSGTGSTLGIGHPGVATCGPVVRTCTVTADAGDGHPASAPQTVAVTFDWPIEPLALAITGASDGQTIDEFGPVQLAVDGTHLCAAGDADYGFIWTCTGEATITPIDARRIRVEHPGPTAALCAAPGIVECKITGKVTVPGGEQQAEATRSLVLSGIADNPQVATVVLEGGPRELTAGERVTFAVEGSHCGPLLEHDWTATLAGSGVVVQSKGNRFTLVVPPVCGGDTLRVDALYGGSGRRLSFDAPVRRSDAPPTVHAPEAADFDPGPVVTLACDDRRVARFEPRIDAACTVQTRWKQVSTLPLEAFDEPAGGLAVEVAPESFGAVVGRTASFELVAEDRAGSSEPQRFDVELRAPKMLALRHEAGANQASSGELIPIQLEIENLCAVGLEGIDVRVAFDGLSYVPGTARLDGAPLADPEPMELAQMLGDKVIASGQLAVIFRNLPSPPSSTQRLTYQVRRMGLQVGDASARADAVLSANPTNHLTDPVSTAASDPWAGGVPAVGCSCQAGSGTSLLPLLGLVAVFMRRRRR